MVKKPIEECRRILVLGSGGAGKSTFARKLSKILDLPVVHLDKHFWKSGWNPMDTKRWMQEVERLIEAEEWVMDGNYDGSLELRLSRTDAVFYLDFSTPLCLFRACKRVFQYIGKSRPDMAPGCQERFSLEFLNWIATFRKNIRPRMLKLLSAKKGNFLLVTFNNPRQLDRYLEYLDEAPKEMSA